MNEDTLISIVVPVYGTEQFLSKCIESIRQQSYRNLEIILVDDHSPDACPQICEDWAEQDERIKVIHHEQNLGVSGARNTGLRNAAGDYITFVDSDDELMPGAVQSLLEDAERYHADIASAYKSPVDKDGRVIGTDGDGEYAVYTGEEALLLSLEGEKNTNSACAKLFKKSFIAGIFFEEGKNVHEDGFFIFRCYLRKPVLVQHNTAVYLYKYREESNSRYGFSDKYLSILYFCEQKKKLIAELCPQYADQANNMEVRTNLIFLDILCRTNDKQYSGLQKSCIKTVRGLYRYHTPINQHHKQLAAIVRSGLYPLYKRMIYSKYHQ